MGNRVDTCNIQVSATCVRSHEQVEAFLSTLLNSTSVKHLFIHISELYASALILTIPTQNPQRNFVPKNNLIFKLVSLNHLYCYTSQKFDIKKQLWNWNKRYGVDTIKLRSMQGLGGAEEKLNGQLAPEGQAGAVRGGVIPDRDPVGDSLDSTDQCLHFPSKLGGNQAVQTKK